MNAVLATSCKERIGRAKYIPESELGEFDGILKAMNAELTALSKGGED